jgi:hypothetical protein
MMPFIEKVFSYPVTDLTDDSSFLDRIKLVLYSLYCKNKEMAAAEIEILIFIRDLYRENGFDFFKIHEVYSHQCASEVSISLFI